MLRHWKGGAALALALTGTAAPAPAAWLKATTKHFTVYSDTGVDTLRRQATELEQFDTLIRRFHHTAPDADAEFNRVTVYVLPTADSVEKLSQIGNVAGFYVPRVSGSVAFTPRLSDDDSRLSPRIVLFHEYAHHFLLGNYSRAYPAWFSEGYAEFVSTARLRQGYYWLGGAADHRGYGLMTGKPLSIRQLFSPPEKMTNEQVDALYGRGWLLTHYCMFDPERRKQLGRYLDLFDAGKPSLDAATEAFGDLAALDRKLDAYLHQRRIPAVRVDPASLGTPTVDVQPLPTGEAALIRMRMISTRGVDAKTAPSLFAKAKAALAPFGRDAVTEGWLAEMAFDAGQLDAAEAAADAALAVDPISSQALLYKARVHLACAGDDPKAWNEARSWILKANRAQNNDAAALALFYESFLLQKAKPSKGAIAGLYRVVALVPQDPSMRFLAARQLVLDGDVAEARQLLRGLASDPHTGTDSAADRLLALLDAGKTGQAAVDALAEADKGGKAGTP